MSHTVHSQTAYVYGLLCPRRCCGALYASREHTHRLCLMSYNHSTTDSNHDSLQLAEQCCMRTTRGLARRRAGRSEFGTECSTTAREVLMRLRDKSSPSSSHLRPLFDSTGKAVICAKEYRQGSLFIEVAVDQRGLLATGPLRDTLTATV